MHSCPLSALRESERNLAAYVPVFHQPADLRHGDCLYFSKKVRVKRINVPRAERRDEPMRHVRVPG